MFSSLLAKSREHLTCAFSYYPITHLAIAPTGAENCAALAPTFMTLGLKVIYTTLAPLSPIYKSSNPQIPVLNRITESGVFSNLRYVASGSIVLLLPNMPHVDRLDLALFDNEKNKPGLRKQLRIDFGEALSSTRCSHLAGLNLEYLFEDPWTTDSQAPICARLSRKQSTTLSVSAYTGSSRRAQV